ncbi:hypothetical protein Tco_1273770 [Tanacetum coccineum]
MGVSMSNFLAMDDLNEHVPQNDSDLQPYSSTLPETFGYVPQLAENTFSQQHMVQAKDCDIYSGPQWIGDYLPGNGFSNMQGQIPYYGTGIGCSSFTEEPFLSMYHHQAAQRDVNPYKQGPNTGLDNAAQHQTNMSVWTSGSGTKSGKKHMKYRDTDRRRRTRVEAALDALENVLPRSREELSQNRLRCEPTSNHLQYLEGYGHYNVHENTATGPLDDILGSFEENPTKCNQLLWRVKVFP